jgi:transposase
MTFEELEADATEDELAAEAAVAKTTSMRGFTRTRVERQTFPEHLPRERVVIDPSAACVSAAAAIVCASSAKT